MPRSALSLEATRLFTGSRERVFAFFTDAVLLAQWWGPRSFTIPSIDFDPRVGARYRIEMQPPGGNAFELVGTFQEADAPSRLTFSFEWRPPDPDDVETVVRLSFDGTVDSTAVRLNQQPFMTEARRALHRDGWNESFDKLAELMTARG